MHFSEKLNLVSILKHIYKGLIRVRINIFPCCWEAKGFSKASLP